MDAVIEKVAPPSNSRPRDWVWNVLTFLVLLGTASAAGVFSLTFAYPNHPLNPFPPAAAILAAAPTQTVPPTWNPTTAAETAQAQSVQAPERADPTAEPAPTQDSPAPTAEPNQASEPASGYAFEVRGAEAMVASSIMHPEAACSWMGVGGEVFDLQGAPLVGISVRMGGQIAGKTVNLLGLAGTVTQYGPAGYEFKLGDQPAASEQSLWIQLLDQAGLPLSGRVNLNTSDNCHKNLVLVNFKQVR